MNRNSSCNSTFSKDLLPPIYGVEMCVALLGNILALWLLVTKEKKNWHTGVMFSCNLIISDIFYALTQPLLIVYYSRGRVWGFGNALCKTERFFFNCNPYVSIYFFMCISVYRHLAIVYPIFTRKHIHTKHIKIISVFVWIFIASISSPVLYYSGLNTDRCFLFANDSSKALKPTKTTYRLLMAVTGCLVPFVVTFGSRGQVVVCMLSIFKNPNMTSLQKKRVALIVGLGCILYTVSFVPFHILQIWHFKLREENNC